MSQKDKDIDKIKENDRKQTQNSIDLIGQSIELKRYKNRIAAKKSREKKNEYIKHLEKENEFLKNDIDFLLRTIFQYDSLSGMLLSFIDILMNQKKISGEELEYIFSFLMELSSKGFADIEGFLKRDMQINNQRIIYSLQKMNELKKTSSNSNHIYYNDEDNNFL